MKSSIVNLTLYSCLVLAVFANPYEGCISLENGRCAACYERMVLQNQTGCGPKLPSDYRCDFYELQAAKSGNGNYCTTCKPGFALETVNPNGSSVGSVETTCVKGELENCAVEVVNPFNAHVCAACTGGLYSVQVKNSTAFTCQKINHPIPNCMWGSIAEQRRITCYRCNEGYAVNPRTRHCEASNQPGCWYNNLKTGCLVCNPFEGFSIDPKGNCFKGASVDTEKVVKKVFGF